MRTRLLVVAAGIVGALAGALLMFSIPTSGGLPSPNRTDAVAGGRDLGKAPVSTLLAWTPDQLPAGLAGKARTIPGVEAVAEVRSGVVWLSGWANEGRAELAAPGGMTIPIEVAAVDPEEYAAFVPPGERARFFELDRGVALLGDAGARARGIGSRGSLRAGETTLNVAGTVDGGLIGAHEAVVSNSTGAQLGIDAPRYLLIALSPEAVRSVIEGELRNVLAAGKRIRVRAPGETPVFRHGDSVLAMSQIKELFGEFAARPQADGNLEIDSEWIDENIVTENLPVLGEVRCHRAVMPQVAAALEEISRRGLGGLIDAGDFGGCFSPRYLNRDSQAGISHHAWGVAVDLNVSGNPFGAEPSMDSRLIEILQRWGLAWGGEWLVPDGMHFEFLRWPLGAKG